MTARIVTRHGREFTVPSDPQEIRDSDDHAEDMLVASLEGDAVRLLGRSGR